MTPTTHLLYLHGFRSSPRSSKAQRMAGLVAELNAQGHAIEWACPQLPPSPEGSIEALKAMTRHWPLETMAVMGSSLGGYYAHVLAERLNIKAVVLNPAINPARDLAKYTGELTMFDDPTVSFTVDESFTEQLRAMHPPRLTRSSRYYAVIAKGDEVLDWREMHECYRDCPGVLLEGSDHGLSDFEQQVPGILTFLNLPHPDLEAKGSE